MVTGFLGDARPAVWGSDDFPTQFVAPATQHQRCLSHQIRDLTYAVEVDGSAGAQWARELLHVFSRALRLHRERGRVTPATLANRRVRIERAADRLIFGFPIGVGEGRQPQKRHRRRRDKLFVCLHREDVEPTNNSSERDLRNSVIHDKVTGGYRARRRSGWSRAWGADPFTAVVADCAADCAPVGLVPSRPMSHPATIASRPMALSTAIDEGRSRWIRVSPVAARSRRIDRSCRLDAGLADSPICIRS